MDCVINTKLKKNLQIYGRNSIYDIISLKELETIASCVVICLTRDTKNKFIICLVCVNINQVIELYSLSGFIYTYRIFRYITRVEYINLQGKVGRCVVSTYAGFQVFFFTK